MKELGGVLGFPNGVFYATKGRDFSYFGFIPTCGLILGLIVGWFYVVFMACFVPCLWHVLWPQLRGYCGGWKRDISGMVLFLVLELPRSCLARYCMEATLLHGWASKLQPSSRQLRGFWCNCVALAHLQASNFAQPYLSCPNSESHVLGLYEKFFES